MNLRSPSLTSQADRFSRQMIREQFLDGGEINFVVSGGSMFPAVRHGDTIRFRHIKPEKLHAGEIVLYERGGRFFAHRFYGTCEFKGGESILVKGDSLFQPMEILEQSSVLGACVKVVHNSRHRAGIPVEALIPGPGALRLMDIYSGLATLLLRFKFLWGRNDPPLICRCACSILLLPLSIPCWIALWPEKSHRKQ